MSTILSVRNVAKRFPRKDQFSIDIRKLLNWSGRTKKSYRSVLKSVSFDLKAGEVIGIMGRNGCGKSTLLQLICGIYSLDKGEVICNGKISYLPAMANGINQQLTMRDNIYLSGILRRLSLSEIDDCCKDIISLSELGDFLDTPVAHFSSGMASRLAFAVTVVFTRAQKADIILLDEVFAGGGDYAFKEKAIKEFELFFQSGASIIFVSHNRSLIEKYCSRSLVIEKGEVLFDGPSKEAIQTYEHLFV